MQVYCNNCDKSGHSFHNCRKPFVSYGIISYRENNNGEIEYLCVCRKHTFGYIDFMRGRYSINNKEQINDIIYEMTVKEKENILNTPFIELWEELWGSSKNSYYLNEKLFANEKFKMLEKGITINGDFYNTKLLIEESITTWQTPEWGFPKGRKNFKEGSRECAMREWSEETGYSIKYIDLIDNIATFDEIVIGSNYQSYKDSYYIGKFIYCDKLESSSENKLPINFQEQEISDAQWLSMNKVIENIRPYHLERIKILKKVDSLLNKSTQYIYG